MSYIYIYIYKSTFQTQLRPNLLFSITDKDSTKMLKKLNIKSDTEERMLQEWIQDRAEYGGPEGQISKQMNQCKTKRKITTTIKKVKRLI